jgi:hypothetical protein
MLLFSREIQTTGDLPAMMPLVQEFVAIAKSVGVPLHVWTGTNGCVAGTMTFNSMYESLAARADATAKLTAAKGWWETLRKFREYAVSSQPDTIYNFVRGGTVIVEIPVGTILQLNQFQLNATGGDFLAALKWMNEFADLTKSITGVDANIIHTIYGTLGQMGYFAGYANAAQIDEVRAKVTANAEWFPKFLEGGKFAMPGSVMQRHVVKIA